MKQFVFVGNWNVMRCHYGVKTKASTILSARCHFSVGFFSLEERNSTNITLLDNIRSLLYAYITANNEVLFSSQNCHTEKWFAWHREKARKQKCWERKNWNVFHKIPLTMAGKMAILLLRLLHALFPMFFSLCCVLTWHQPINCFHHATPIENSRRLCRFLEISLCLQNLQRFDKKREKRKN